MRSPDTENGRFGRVGHSYKGPRPALPRGCNLITGHKRPSRKLGRICTRKSAWSRPCVTSPAENWSRCNFLLGHVSVQTTERYLGCKQKLRNAVNGGIDLVEA